MKGKNMSTESISRHRLSEAPGETYTRTILEPSYRFMMENYFDGLVETNEAWVVMLQKTDIISRENAKKILTGLARIRNEGEESFENFNPAYEYFYSHIENRLGEYVGTDASGEINIARTRPEPLTRLALRKKILAALHALSNLTELLMEMAQREAETIMPQWTHMQPAQPTTLGHYLLGIVSALDRDASRLEASYVTTNVSTLGCGALAGTSYPIDRNLVAELLGFDGVRENTIDCVASGDYAMEASSALANLAVTLSRLSQDMYIWHTAEFGFVEIGDAFAGSSSMMPQKKNAYPFEYVRARAARAVSDMASVYSVLHNTNFGDIKDVEEEMVPPALRVFEETTVSLELLLGTLGTLQVNRERLEDCADAAFSTATELAAVIHRNTDLDFRSAHRVVGSLVRLATEKGVRPRDVTKELFDQAAQMALGRDVDLDESSILGGLNPRDFVLAHTVSGGAAPDAVRTSLVGAKERHDEHRRWLRSTEDKLLRGREQLVEQVGLLTSHG
jgi:argininosuccinate lyase